MPTSDGSLCLSKVSIAFGLKKISFGILFQDRARTVEHVEVILNWDTCAYVFQAMKVSNVSLIEHFVELNVLVEVSFV
jgi:hypothetical protein